MREKARKRKGGHGCWCARDKSVYALYVYTASATLTCTIYIFLARHCPHCRGALSKMPRLPRQSHVQQVSPAAAAFAAPRVCVHALTFFRPCRCDHQRCRQCCKAHCAEEKLDCASHRQFFSGRPTEANGGSSDQAALSKKAKLDSGEAQASSGAQASSEAQASSGAPASSKAQASSAGASNQPL